MKLKKALKKYPINNLPDALGYDNYCLDGRHIFKTRSTKKGHQWDVVGPDYFEAGFNQREAVQWLIAGTTEVPLKIKQALKKYPIEAKPAQVDPKMTNYYLGKHFIFKGRVYVQDRPDAWVCGGTGTPSYITEKEAVAWLIKQYETEGC